MASGKKVLTFLSILGAAALLAGCRLSSASSGQGISVSLPVDTIAGVAGVLGSSDGSGVSASFSSPSGVVAVGTSLYIADTGNGSIRKLDLNSGAVTTFASGFTNPHGITSDGTSLYLADTSNHVIRSISLATAAVATLAGLAGNPGSADGVGAAARFNNPYGITTDGTNLYVSDTNTYTIRQIVISTANVTTLAGTADSPGSADGTGAAAQFQSPYGIVVVGPNLYIADSANYTIRQLVIASGVVTTIAGQVATAGTTDATGTSARFNEPTGLATDGTSLFIADSYNDTIRQMNLGSAAVTTLAGQPGKPGGIDGDKYSATGVYKYNPALFNYPVGVCTLSGHLYVADNGNSVIREIL